jgi:hypothetical protein
VLTSRIAGRDFRYRKSDSAEGSVFPQGHNGGGSSAGTCVARQSSLARNADASGAMRRRPARPAASRSAVRSQLWACWGKLFPGSDLSAGAPRTRTGGCGVSPVQSGELATVAGTGRETARQGGAGTSPAQLAALLIERGLRELVEDLCRYPAEPIDSEYDPSERWVSSPRG